MKKDKKLQDFGSAPIGGKICHIKENKISGGGDAFYVNALEV